MKHKELINDFQKLLSEEEPWEAASFLEPFLVIGTSRYKTFCLVKAQANDLRTQISRGTYSVEEYEISKSKVRKRFFELVIEIKEEDVKAIDKNSLIEILREENKRLRLEIQDLKLYQNSRSFKNDREFASLKNLEGFWLEVIDSPKKIERAFSIGFFHFSENIYEFRYNGTNYFNNGLKYYDWKSIEIISDFRRNYIYYIYVTMSVENKLEEKYGFGLLQLPDSNEIGIERGYFIDAGDNKPKKPKQHEMLKLSEVVQKINKVTGKELQSSKRSDHGEIIATLCSLYLNDPKFLNNISHVSLRRTPYFPSPYFVRILPHKINATKLWKKDQSTVVVLQKWSY